MFSHGEVARFNIRKEKDKDYENHIDLLMEQNRSLSAKVLESNRRLSAQVLESNRRLSSLDSDIKEMIDEALIEKHVPKDFQTPKPGGKHKPKGGSKGGSRQLGGVLRSGDWCWFGQIYNSHTTTWSANMSLSSEHPDWWNGCQNCPRGVTAATADSAAWSDDYWFGIDFYEKCI